MLDLQPQTQNKTSFKALWAPQAGPQEALVHCPLPEVFFGGARGGGKTDGVLGKWAKDERTYGQHFNAMMFRKTTVASDDAIERAKEIYLPLGATFVASPHPRFRMPNGGRIGFGYLESIDDANAWQGRNLTHVWIEEAGLYGDSAPIMRLFGVLRSAHGVPVQMILTANPGGAGQHWIRTRYKLWPFPDGPMVLNGELPNGAVHRIAVIPSRLTDNKILLESDPGYVNRLYLVGSSALVRAWLEGDWSAIEGAFFDCWNNERHIIDVFVIPSHWNKFIAGDWGSARPFSFGWYAIVGEDCRVHKRLLKRGALIKYREFYGMQKDKPNVGLKLHAEIVQKMILERTGLDEKLDVGVIDPACFAESGGPSIAERMMSVKIEGRSIVYREADNKRVRTAGALGGWDQMRGRLVGDEDGNPMLIFMNVCEHSIRTIPVLQHDTNKAEDLDTDAEDHAADETRYACMSRPFVKTIPEAIIRKREGYSALKDTKTINQGLVL
jgi:hypothetical protein